MSKKGLGITYKFYILRLLGRLFEFDVTEYIFGVSFSFEIFILDYLMELSTKHDSRRE